MGILAAWPVKRLILWARVLECQVCAKGCPGPLERGREIDLQFTCFFVNNTCTLNSKEATYLMGRDIECQVCARGCSEFLERGREIDLQFTCFFVNNTCTLDSGVSLEIQTNPGNP